jgi:hypothetical protein
MNKQIIYINEYKYKIILYIVLHNIFKLIKI